MYSQNHVDQMNSNIWDTFCTQKIYQMTPRYALSFSFLFFLETTNISLFSVLFTKDLNKTKIKITYFQKS
jgi:hypothetical protein